MSTGPGTDHDVVTIKIGDNEVEVIESYEIVQEVLTQPASLTLRLGYGGAVSAIIEAAKPGTPFEIAIDDAVQFKGRIDSVSSSGRGTSAHEVTIKGRDHLAPLHDHHVTAARSFNNITYEDLVITGLKASAPNFHGHILGDDTAWRKAASKAPDLQPPSSAAASERVGTTQVFSVFAPTGEFTVSQGTAVGFPGAPTRPAATEAATAPQSAPSGSQRTIQAKIGQRWLEGVIKPELDRVGLVLFAAPNGTDLILQRPAFDRPPTARILNQRGDEPNVTIEGYEFTNDTTGRYASCDVHFRGGGDGVESRTRGWGHAEDPEMQAFGFTKVMTHEDHKCKTLAQADFLARRKLAEANRQGWRLRYTVTGHTVIGTAGTRIIWAPNTTVDVQDDELDIHGTFYIEGVHMSRNPETRTDLVLMRPGDVLFGEPEGT